MSRGRRKKNSIPFGSSRRTSSRVSARWRYPASRSMALADSDREPLLGTATRSIWRGSFGRFDVDGAGLRSSQMLVDVAEPEATGHHHHLHVVQQLGDLLGEAVVALELG